jgi:hypothetical protein
MTPKTATGFAVCFLVAAVLTGCAHGPRVGQSPYQPSSQNGKGYGYSELQLNERTIQVTFSGVTSTDAHTGAIRRAAEVALLWGADGFVIMNGEDYLDPVVRSRFVVGQVKRDQPVTVLTIHLLMREEFAGAPPGTTIYDARLLAPNFSVGYYPARQAPPAYSPARY